MIHEARQQSLSSKPPIPPTAEAVGFLDGGVVKGGETAVQVIVEFDKGLFQHFDVPGWNAFVANLVARNLVPPAWTKGERLEPLAAMLDFRGLRRPHYRLDGIDLRCCWLERADFTGASLRDARLGCGRDVCYKGARLHGADFRHVEISGCDFTDAVGLDAALFDGAAYDPANPPEGLPPGILALCKAEADPPPSDPRQPSNPAEPAGFRQAPLRCHATIHMVPMEA